jgi:hypothetical protein
MKVSVYFREEERGEDSVKTMEDDLKIVKVWFELLLFFIMIE